MNEKKNQTPSSTLSKKSAEPKNVKKTLIRLGGYLKSDWKIIAFIAFASIAVTLFNVYSPIVLGNATTSIFDSVTSNSPINFDHLMGLIVFLIILYVLSSLFSYLQAYLMAGVS